MSVLCYNKGCGQRFDPEKNLDDVCTYHPGVPVFHDALKGWSCCKRRTTDFSDFLSIAGCTKGPHNQEKPPEPIKPEVRTSGEKKDVDDVKPKFNESIIQAPKPVEAILRPSPDEPVSRLQQKVSASLKQALENLQLSDNTPDKKEEEGDTIKIGTSCKNGGCTKTFNGAESNEELCLYHAGVPIFHEGMKYWSCCKRKTSDFNTFLSQEGCTKGNHQWQKKTRCECGVCVRPVMVWRAVHDVNAFIKSRMRSATLVGLNDSGKKIVPCRFDWHQTGSQVIITVYAKNSIPELSYVDANSTQLHIHILFDGDKEFEQKIILWGVIDTSKSSLNMMAAKIEIVLKKAEPMSWARLDLPPAVSPPKEEEKKRECDSDSDSEEDDDD